MNTEKTAPPPYTPYPTGHANVPPPPGINLGPTQAAASAQTAPKQQYVAAPQLHAVQQPLPNFGPEAQRCSCPHCHAIITTQIKTEPTTRTHLAALILLCLCWPCTCVPYCVDSCQNMNHYCPNCNAYLGTYQN